MSHGKGHFLSHAEGHLIRFSRIPWTVGTDPKLSSFAVRVYVILAAHVFEGSTARIGVRALARYGAMSKNTANAAIVELSERGHIGIANMGRGQRQMYVLHSEMFGQKQGKVNIVRSTPRGKRLVSVEKTA